jgi:hypothetical protein
MSKVWRLRKSNIFSSSSVVVVVAMVAAMAAWISSR